jgi:SIT4 phosphatase-associated protein
MLSDENAAAAGGDIWSSGVFLFESPLKDLLDSGVFTVEDLLNEDELLQELRGLEPRLMQFLSQPSSVTCLIQHVILASNSDVQRLVQQWKQSQSLVVNTESLEATKATEETNDNIDVAQLPSERIMLRFPYMACEVICCEVESIIDTCVSGYITLPGLLEGEDEVEDDDIREVSSRITAASEPSGTDNVVEAAPAESSTTNDVVNEEDDSAIEVVAQQDALSPSHPLSAGENSAQPLSDMPAESTTSSKTSEPRPRILDLLFSLLISTPPGDLDDYRAGYFEKLLALLFRKRPREMADYLNQSTTPLLTAMISHLYSHSILQVAQRLLLPKQPVGKELVDDAVPGDDAAGGVKEDNGELILAGDDIVPPKIPHPPPPKRSQGSLLDGDYDEDDDEDDQGDDKNVVQNALFDCKWSESPEALDLLLNSLLCISTDGNAADSSKQPWLTHDRQLSLTQNVAEVLINIIQHSLLSSRTMLTLTSTSTLARIIDAATRESLNYFSPHESPGTAAMNVLESLVLQLGGYGSVGTMSLIPEEVETTLLMLQQQKQDQNNGNIVMDHEGNESIEAVRSSNDASAPGNEEATTVVDTAKAPLIADLSSLLELLPNLLDALVFLLRNPCTDAWRSPMQFNSHEPQKLLGSSRLRIVRLLEALVLLGDPQIDSCLVQSHCLSICLDLFWEFPWCSMLHQSVANLLVHVFEGGNDRYEVQSYLLIQCNLMGRLMDSYADQERTNFYPVANPGETAPPESTTAPTPSMSSSEMVDDNGSVDRLEVSEDDVDAAMEQSQEQQQKQPNGILGAESCVGMVESTTALTSDGLVVETVPQSFRKGYMGHVIIICQALVHASSDDGGDEYDEDGNKVEGNVSTPEDGNASNSQDPVGYKEPSLLADLVGSHPDIDRWSDFVTTTLQNETNIQSTPLGGFSSNGATMEMTELMMNGFIGKPGPESNFGGADEDGGALPLAPRSLLDFEGEPIDIADSYLDVAGISLRPKVGTTATSTDGSDEGSGGSGDSQRTYESGETMNSSGYLFDDPLGRLKGGLGIELGKLTKYHAAPPGVPRGEDSADADGEEHVIDSSSDEEPSRDDEDVPVMDLFAGNFADGGAGVPAPVPGSGGTFSFANFDEAFGESAEEVGTSQTVESSCGERTEATKVSSFSASLCTVLDDPVLSIIRPHIDDIFGNGDHASLLEDEVDGKRRTKESIEERSHSLVTPENGVRDTDTVDPTISIDESPTESPTAQLISETRVEV